MLKYFQIISRITSFGVLGTILLFPLNSFSEDKQGVGNKDQLMELLNKIDTRQNEILEQQAKIDQQKQEIEDIRKQVERVIGKEIPNSVVNKSFSQKKVKKKASAAKDYSSVDKVGIERRPIPKKQPPKIAAVPNDGGVLLAPGSAVVETGFEYTRSSALRVAIEGFTIVPALNIGSFEISEVDRDTITTSVAMRVGLLKGFEMSARVPYVYRRDATATRPIGTGSSATTTRSVDGANMGDVEVSGHYQINNGKNGLPFFIGNLRFKTITGESPFEVPLDSVTNLQRSLPTGSGFYSLQPSVTAIYPTEPAVIYGNLGYLINFERNVGGTFGEIDPGDAINYSLGVGFSVNEDTSLSFSYGHDVVFRTKQNGAVIPTSDILHVVSLTSGLSHKISDKVSVNLNVSAGLTSDAPDMRVGVKVPVKFDLW